MTQCWPEGELRAHLDGELPSGDRRRLEEHLRHCGACAALPAELKARSMRISALLEDLPAASRRARTVPPRRSRAVKRSAGAALALAASLAIALLVLPKRMTRPVASAMRPPVKQNAPTPVPPPVRVAPAIIRKVPSRRIAPRRNKPQIVDYIALDSQPIDTGIVVRVGLENGRIPADVIFGPDGQARAIRLVNDFSGEQ